MRIGFDLDQTVYGFPEFFRVLIPPLHAAGCKLYCTSNHLRGQWPDDCERLRALGIDPDMLDPSLMQQGPKDHGWAHKKWMAQHVDYMFDDFEGLQDLTQTPVFICPHKKASDWRR